MICSADAQFVQIMLDVFIRLQDLEQIIHMYATSDIRLVTLFCKQQSISELCTVRIGILLICIPA
jgi:hypothetical protein